MVVFYIDTSVMVKRYMEEPGTEFADILFDNVLVSKNHSMATSVLGMVEFIATIRRARKGNVIEDLDLHNIIHHFSKEMEKMNLLSLDEKTLANSIEVIMDHSLRTADALHLSSALELKKMMTKVGERFFLVTNDKEMIDAAKSSEMNVLMPDENGILELNALFG